MTLPPRRKIAFVLSEADAAALQRILYRAATDRTAGISTSDFAALMRLERRLKDARNGRGQLDPAIIESVRGAKPCSLKVEVGPR